MPTNSSTSGGFGGNSALNSTPSNINNTQGVTVIENSGSHSSGSTGGYSGSSSSQGSYQAPVENNPEISSYKKNDNESSNKREITPATSKYSYADSTVSEPDYAVRSTDSSSVKTSISSDEAPHSAGAFREYNDSLNRDSNELSENGRGYRSPRFSRSGSQYQQMQEQPSQKTGQNNTNVPKNKKSYGQQNKTGHAFINNRGHLQFKHISNYHSDYPKQQPNEEESAYVKRRDNWYKQNNIGNSIYDAQAEDLVNSLTNDYGYSPQDILDVVNSSRNADQSLIPSPDLTVYSRQLDAVQNRINDMLGYITSSPVSSNVPSSLINDTPVVDGINDLYGFTYEPDMNKAEYKAYLNREFEAQNGRRRNSEEAEIFRDEFENVLWPNYRESFRRPKQVKERDYDAEKKFEEKQKEYVAIEKSEEFLFQRLIVDGESRNDSERVYEYPDKVRDEMELVASMYGLDLYDTEDYITFCRMIRLATGLGVDQDGKVLNTEWDRFKISAENMRKACIMVRVSQEQFGHPFGTTQLHLTTQWGGRLRFSVGCIDYDLALALTSNPQSALYRDDLANPAMSLVEAAKNTWLTDTLPMLEQSVMQDIIPSDQLASIRHMVIAMCNHRGIEPEEYAVSRYSETDPMLNFGRQNSFKQYMENDPDVGTIADERNKALMAYQASKNKGVKFSDAASIVFGTGLSAIRGTRILLDVPLLVSAEGEHFINNAEQEIINRIAYRNKEQYQPTKELDDTATSMKFTETLAVIKTLQDSAGWETVDDFLKSGRPITAKSVSRWLAETTPSYREVLMQRLKDSGSSLDKLLEQAMKLTDTFNSVVGKWMPGDYGFNEWDAKTFIHCLLADQARMDGEITSDELLKAITSDTDRALREIFLSDEGKEAYVSSKALYGGRISILPEAFKAHMKTHIGQDIIWSGVVDSWYFGYAIKAFELWFPMSNTIQLAGLKGLEWAMPHVDKMPGRIQNIIKQRVGDGSFTNNAMGANMSKAQFKKCLAYDAMRLGQNGATALFLMVLIQALGGLQPPEDDEGNINEDLLYLPWEWRIKDPISGELTPFRQAWWLDDIMQWSLPAAVSLCSSGLFKGYGEYAIDDPMRMFWNGVNDIFGGNQVYGSVANLIDMPVVGYDIYKKIDDGTIIPDLVGNFFNKSTPLALYDIWPMFWKDDFERNPFKRVANSEGKEEGRSNFEATWNKYAIENPILAGILNFFQGENLYGREATAIRTVADPRAETARDENSFMNFKLSNKLIGTLKSPDFQSYCERYGVSGNEVVEAAYAEYITNLIDSVGGASKAQENGILLSLDDFRIVKNYYGRQLDTIYENIRTNNEAVLNGSMTSNYRYNLNNVLYGQASRISAKLKNMEYNDIVYDSHAYKVVEGTNVYNPETDEWYNYGDQKAGHFIDPIITPQAKTEGPDYMSGHYGIEIGNNYETNYYGEKSDSSSTMKTSGGRNLVANTDSRNVKAMMDEMNAELKNWDEKFDELKGNKSSTSSGSSGSSGGYYRRSYSSGGGGGGYSSSSYEPKISSYSPRINSANPATMYSKTPYSTSTRYLSPTVYTSGSRDSYSRRES